MAILIFLLSLALLAAGIASGYASLDLLPTGLGVLYALAGAVAVSAAVVTFALGVAIRRIDGLARLVRAAAARPLGVPPEAGEAPALDSELARILKSRVAADGTATKPLEGPVLSQRETSNDEGHSSEGPGSVLETPESPPALIGRYSSGGANYLIFADGSIEAETAEGRFRFASMGDFKRYLIDRKGEKGE